MKKRNTKRGPTASAQDIEVRLKDPNSLESKLFNQCLLVAEIHHREFILLLHIMQMESKRAANALMTNEELRAERAQENEARYYSEQYSRQMQARPEQPSAQSDSAAYRLQQRILDSLKQDMATLLATPQHNMTIAQLAAHHKKITANYNNQIAAALGLAINVPVVIKQAAQNIALAVPQLAAKPIAPAAQILQQSPALPNSPQFAAHITLAGLGYLAVLNKWREILEHNRDSLSAAGIDVDDIQLTPATLKKIDQATQATLNDTPGLLMHLLENNLRTLGKTEAIAKLPTLFAMKPVIGTAKRKEEEEPALGVRANPKP